jgi:hypothetical protein
MHNIHYAVFKKIIVAFQNLSKSRLKNRIKKQRIQLS